MKSSLVRFSFSLILCLLALGCKTPPPAASDSNSDAPVSAPLTTKTNADPAEASAPDSNAAGQPEEAAAVTVPEPDSDTAVVSDPAPAEDRELLYFYPEPDALLVLTVPEPVSPAPVAPSANAPASAPAARTSPVAASVPVAPQRSATPATPVLPAAAAVPSAAAGTSSAARTGTLTGEPLSASAVPSPTVTAVQEPLASAAELRPDRVTSVSLNQFLEVVYPGSGWVFLGDSTSQNGIRYESRKLDGANTLFSFRPLRTGTYLLTFSRFDVLNNNFMADTLQVTVTEAVTGQAEKVRAPEYREYPELSGNAEREGEVTAETTRTAVSRSGEPTNEPSLVSAPSDNSSTLTTAQPPADPATVLSNARAALARGEISKTLELLDEYFSRAVTAVDEGWFVRGQAYEANSPLRDIRAALAAYETLTTAFPDSVLWKDADERIRFIKQFYFNIR